MLGIWLDVIYTVLVIKPVLSRLGYSGPQFRVLIGN